jgi:hypothetical protein
MTFNWWTTRAGPIAGLLGLLLTTSFGVGAPAASAADNGSWSVQPTTAPGAPVRQYFVYDLAAGTVVKDSVTIVNEATTPQTFDVYPTDGFTTPQDGGLGFVHLGQPQHGIGLWAKVSRSRITVLPGHRVDIPFHIRVPAGTAPGDEVGAIVALNTAIQPGPAGSTDIGVQKAVAARVYARVQGPVTPGLVVQGIQLDRSGPVPMVRFTVLNTGNVRLQPTATATISGLLGAPTTLPATDLGMLLPGDQSSYELPAGSLPTLNYVTLTVAVSADQTSATGSTAMLLYPWWLLLVLAALLLALGALLVRRLRRNRGRSAEVVPAVPEEVMTV